MNGSNLLTTIFCTTVGFFVGAMVARLLPNHLLDWGNAPEWVAALSALATAIFAWKALTVWREEMRGGSKHAAAAEIAEAASLTRYYFYEARIPMYLVDEYPEPYHALKPEDRDEVGAWRHIFNNRYKGVHEQVLRLATLRAKAYALLGIEVASAVEALARQATGLRRFF